jgi:hypothetical protein
MKWKIHFDGTRDESVVFQFLQDIQDQMELAITPEIDVVRGMKILLTGEAREWFRLVAPDTNAWSDFCERLKREFLPRDFAETALDRLKSFKQSEQESIALYVARFNQGAKFLPDKLPVSEKPRIIKRSIRPYYQDKICEKEVNSIDRLLELCDSIDKIRLNIEKFQPQSVTPPEPKLLKCFSCKRPGHLSKNCPEAKSAKCYKCGKSGYIVRTFRPCKSSENSRKTAENSGRR